MMDFSVASLIAAFVSCIPVCALSLISEIDLVEDRSGNGFAFGKNG